MDIDDVQQTYITRNIHIELQHVFSLGLSLKNLSSVQLTPMLVI